MRDRSGGTVRGGVATIIGALFANVVDGFDVLAVAFTGSAIMAEWHLSPALLGTIFSAGLAGMMLGSLFIAPLADRYGRRPVSLACMATMSLGMFAAAGAHTPVHLITARLLTGLGIGGVLAALNTVVAEIAPPARRNTILAVFSAGYPLGSVLGGLLAIGLVSSMGWRVVFVGGGALTALALLINAFTLPESAAPAARIRLFGGAFFRTLFGGANRSITLAYCAAFMLHMLAFFFILNWTPKLVEAMGFTAEQGNGVTVVINLGSLLGPLFFGWLADRLGLFRMARYYFLLFAASIVLLGLAPPVLPVLYAAALLAGLAMAGAMTSLYASAPVIFPAPVRAAGTGLGIGIGRLGGTLGPMLGGAAIGAGMGRVPLHVIMAVPVFAVFLIIAFGGFGSDKAVDSEAEPFA